MSVAFRREGDDEHLEPKFELPIPPGPNLVTARGLAMIGERIAELKKKLEALEEEPAIKVVKRDLRYWQTRLSTAELAPVSSGERVVIGTTVSFTLRGQTKSLSIVGDDEADPAKALVSFSAPIVRAMVGAQEGDFVDFAGEDEAIEILSITPS